jgi:polysaccharide biosynthesis/export protein
LKYLYLLCLAVVISFASCIQQKNTVYFYEYMNDTIPIVQDLYKIQKEDIIHVSTKSLTNNDINFLLNSGDPRTSGANNDLNMILTGYRVNEEGNILLPLIGEIEVLDLTLNQAEDRINKALKKYMKNSYVSLRLVNFKVTLLGEINVPGTYNFYNNNVTIFQALSEAGDITDYGNKKKVTLIRQVEDKKQTIEFDLTNTDIIGTQYYHLMPNDVIYVSPVKGKFFRENISLYSFVLSSVTTFILIMNYIQY